MGLQPSVLPEKVSLSLLNSQVTDTATQSKTPDWLCHDKGCKLKTVFIKLPYLFKSTICLHPSQPKSFLSSSFRLQITQRHKPEPIGCGLVWIMARLKESLCSIRFLLPNPFYLTREWKDAIVCLPFGGDGKLERHKWTWKKEQSDKLTIGMLGNWYMC